jgi:hypothetical protein
MVAELKKISDDKGSGLSGGVDLYCGGSFIAPSYRKKLYFVKWFVRKTVPKRIDDHKGNGFERKSELMLEILFELAGVW